MTDKLTEALRAVTAESLQIIRLLDAAAEIQWEPSPVPKPREDTTQRAKGGHGDPTGDIVLDARRLAVRESFTRAERALADYLAFLRSTRQELARAVENWNGETVE
ncbi:hypothetical protein ARTSIC4J27_210 [Pseudarthrobacter siccitolerans]|uniref:Uncharacterized protein n=1 Tax=Pseudarthrobacter siccitolerans TaxID=861266 RepID=A0A024GXS9_9MICC|nr:hypothetical protein [Pseudarthrobacter siccitolerans]CCQ44286.1 hypothetical protein ARTSIC4J27_210 [Pseudarthrobacter siccitolerans]